MTLAIMVRIVLIVAACSWIFYDSKKLEVWKKKPADFLDASPTMWAIGALVCMLPVLIIYLIRRPEYVRLAEQRKAQELFDQQNLGEPSPTIWPPPPNSGNSQ